MSKERLEDLVKKRNENRGLNKFEVDWLVGYAKEQAERVQELKEINEQLQSKNIASNSKLFYLEKQNKRYREAIERARRELETCARSAYLTLSKVSEGEE